MQENAQLSYGITFQKVTGQTRQFSVYLETKTISFYSAKKINV